MKYLLFTHKHTSPRSIASVYLCHGPRITGPSSFSPVLDFFFKGDILSDLFSVLGMLLPAMAFTTALAAVLFVVLPKILNVRKTQDVSFSVIIDLLQCICWKGAGKKSRTRVTLNRQNGQSKC